MLLLPLLSLSFLQLLLLLPLHLLLLLWIVKRIKNLSFLRHQSSLWLQFESTLSSRRPTSDRVSLTLLPNQQLLLLDLPFLLPYLLPWSLLLVLPCRKRNLSFPFR